MKFLKTMQIMALSCIPIFTYADNASTFTSTAIFQQDEKTLKGVVEDIYGEPLIGVNIKVKGTNTGTITDLDGVFVLKDIPYNAILQITYVGYESKEIKAKNNMTIVLREDSKILEEVVVVGYASQKKVNLSGAVSAVSTDKIEDRPVLSVGQSLQGLVPNFNVSIASGQANTNPSFNIRGTTSLNGGSPLIIIDGMASSSSTLNRINPSDIANISILKDAASAAIYGSRAAFGIVLVTTKSGKSEKMRVNYNNNIVVRTITESPKIITDPFDVATIKNVMSKPWYNLYGEEQLAYAKKRSEDPLNTSPYFKNPNGSYSYFGNTDWVDEAYKDYGLSTQHSVDISGKTDKVAYYLSANYNYQGGMIEYGNDTYNRYNLRSKLDFQVTDFLKISNNTNFISSDYERPTYLGNSYYWEIVRLNPLSVPYNQDGSWTDDGASVLGRMSEGGRTTNRNNDFRTQFTGKLDIIKNVLFVNASFSYTTKFNKDRYSVLPVAYYEGEGYLPKYYNDVSSAGAASSNSDHYLYEIYGTFDKTFNKKHHITAIAGFNQENYRYEYLSANRKELISNSLPTLGLATGEKNVGESISTYALRGAFARLNYVFDSRYILEFNGRYDGTSRFQKDSRFAFNPSGSLAWVISEEPFFKPLKKHIEFLKFRASYGSLGNQNVGNYAYIPTMGSGTSGVIVNGEKPVYVSAPGLTPGDLTWEKVTTTNFGLDFNLFGNRLVFSGDYYIRDTKDMLTKGMRLPTVLGTGVPKENAADLQTKGWEISLKWNDNITVLNKPFVYGVGFTLADSRAYITKFENPDKRLGDYYVGREFGEIWGLQTDGFFTSQKDIDNHADQSLVTSYPGTRPLAPGDIKFKDVNGDKKIDWGKWTYDDHGDYSIIGNSRKRFTFGFNANAQWNGFDMSLFIQGVGKRDYAPGSGDLFFWGIYSQPWTNITYGNMNDRWTEDNPNGYFPRMKSYVAENGNKEAGIAQTKYLQNAAYARLKNLTFGYTLPKTLTRKVDIERLRFYFSGDNLFEVSGLYKHYKVDPEGLGGQMYPFQRSFSFGMNLTF